MIEKGSEESKKKLDYKKEPVNNNQRLIKKIVVSIVLITIAIIILTISIYIKTAITISYNEQNNLDYKVYLKPNNYFNTQYLGEDMQYISSLIDYIYINFNYHYATNKTFSYNSSYHVEAELVIFEKNKPNSVIFEKKHTIVDEIKSSNIDVDSFNINEEIEIKYSEYNNIVKWFKSDYNISADSHLKITLYTKTENFYEKYNYPVKTDGIVEITIPLTEQMINITTNYKENNEENKAVMSPNIELLNGMILVVSLVFGALASLSVVQVAILVYKINKQKSFYEKKKRKIFKNYDRVIVQTQKVVTIKNEENIIDVTTFEELLDASDRLGRPVLFMERTQGKTGWFMVKSAEEIYRYILNEKD